MSILQVDPSVLNELFNKTAENVSGKMLQPMPSYNSNEYRLAPIGFTFVLEVRTATGVLSFCAKTETR